MRQAFFSIRAIQHATAYALHQHAMALMLTVILTEALRHAAGTMCATHQQKTAVYARLTVERALPLQEPALQHATARAEHAGRIYVSETTAYANQ